MQHTGTVHFISDLHLSANRPAVAMAFARYLAGPAQGIEALYILGDLLDAWPGDDALGDPAAQAVVRGLAALAGSGTQVFLMVGNRDFMIGEDFARAAHATLLAEPHRIQLGDTPALLMHGDALCTDDVEYQRFRAMVRNPAWRASVLAKSLPERLALAASIQMQSEQSKQGKRDEIMDVNAEAVAQTLREAGFPLLIHGHTHRPAQHLIDVDEHACTRWVLHDWHDHAEWLAWQPAAGLAFQRA